MNKLGKIGEFGLIKRFKKAIKTDSSVIVGSGDDCAVMKFDKRHYQLFTCDMLVEGVDFISGADPYLVGRKAAAVSLSDIAACAGTPKSCVVSLGFPKKTKLNYLDRVFAGFRDICRKYKVNIVGGDLSRADRLVIDVSMLGLVPKERLVLRSGAKPGDIIFVTGPLGGSIAGKHLTFTPRLKEAQFLSKNFDINAMIDISDGLIADLGHILEQSVKGANIYEELIPLSTQAKDIDDALYGGEDFELIFTIPRKQAKELIAKFAGFYPIGEIVSGKTAVMFINRKGKERRISRKGFTHF